MLLAISLDYGYINVSQAELRRSVDATAMAACWELYDQQTQGTGNSFSLPVIRSVASRTAAENTISNQSPVIGTALEDLAIGRYDFSTGSFSASYVTKPNAVRVSLSRQSALNGEVPLFFGSLTGRSSQALKQHAVAAMLNDLQGFSSPMNNLETVDILPIALDLPTWEAVVASSTNDSFRFENDRVLAGSDGLFECNLYPQGTGSPGNRGTVDIGSQNNSTADISRQVLDGISAQDFVDLGKPLRFDAAGVLTLNGDTGISAGIKDELASIIGQKRIIPIYRSVSGNGNNATYTIVRFEGVRILDVKLTGPRMASESSCNLQRCSPVMQSCHPVVATPATIWSPQ